MLQEECDVDGIYCEIYYNDTPICYMLQLKTVYK